MSENQEIKKKSVGEDALTEQEVYDYYQERSQTTNERATQLAWMFIIMETGAMIAGENHEGLLWASFMACGYMLLSMAQALWQTITAWLFKQKVRKMIEAPKDYPEWIGAGAWFFFLLKMVAIVMAFIVLIASYFL